MIPYWIARCCELILQKHSLQSESTESSSSAAPRLAGLPLKLFAWAVESSWSSSILPKLKRDSNIPQVWFMMD